MERTSGSSEECVGPRGIRERARGQGLGPWGIVNNLRISGNTPGGEGGSLGAHVGTLHAHRSRTLVFLGLSGSNSGFPSWDVKRALLIIKETRLQK